MAVIYQGPSRASMLGAALGNNFQTGLQTGMDESKAKNQAEQERQKVLADNSLLAEVLKNEDAGGNAFEGINSILPQLQSKQGMDMAMQALGQTRQQKYANDAALFESNLRPDEIQKDIISTNANGDKIISTKVWDKNLRKWVNFESFNETQNEAFTWSTPAPMEGASGLYQQNSKTGEFKLVAGTILDRPGLDSTAKLEDSLRKELADSDIYKKHNNIKMMTNDIVGQFRENGIQIKGNFNPDTATNAEIEALINSAESQNVLDNIMIFGFQKYLDPDSVVRESEFARSADGQAFFAKMRGWASNKYEGGSGLSKDEKVRFVKSFFDMRKTAQKGYKDLLVNTYIPIAKDRGYNLKAITIFQDESETFKAQVFGREPKEETQTEASKINEKASLSPAAQAIINKHSGGK